MTIKRCMVCGNPFSTKKTKILYFCSKKCKYKFNDKEDNLDEEWLEKQTIIDYKAKQRNIASDNRLIRR